jgi:DNA modification methylase
MKNNGLTKNLLICGDNLKVLDDLIKKGIKVDLIYLDPPFFSNKHYEVVWGDEAEVRSFKDRWAGGIHVYIDWMKERIVKMYDALNETGSFYLHCDSHASHYLKIMLDDIFGFANFQNEIIWRRTPFKGSSKSRAKQLPRCHDVILFYTKGKDWIWNSPTQPYGENYLKRFKWKDERGYYRKTLLKTYSQETLNRLKKENRLIGPTKQGAKYSYKQYLEESRGAIQIDDVWTDINMINPVAKERLGYPTQKPEALVERIINTSSNKGNIVLDPFCGCGTAMAVAHRLNRKWIGIDISPTAISLIRKRIEKLGAIKSKDYEVIGMPTTLSELRALEAFEFQNWVINEMQAKQSKRLAGDKGIDGYYDKSIFTEPAGIQVKQSENVGRNVIDNFETALQRKKYNKGYVVGFSFTKDAHEEAARVKEEKGVYIKLVKVEDLLLGKAKA